MMRPATVDDHLVVLRAIDRRHCAKTFTKVYDKSIGADRIKETSFSGAKHFTVEEIVIDGFDGMSAALDAIERDPCAFLIRGEPLPGPNRRRTQRKGKTKPSKDDTFKAAARNWLPLDFDDIEAPPLTDVAADPDAAVQHLIGQLPPELHDVSCRWQFTSSQGLPGTEGSLSVRLFTGAANRSPTPS